VRLAKPEEYATIHVVTNLMKPFDGRAISIEARQNQLNLDGIYPA
jgi:hypothetical protein